MTAGHTYNTNLALFLFAAIMWSMTQMDNEAEEEV